jgi:hypothetical protein
MRRPPFSFFFALVLIAGCSTEYVAPAKKMDNVIYEVSLEPGQKNDRVCFHSLRLRTT